jgi:iron-sulfur cluster repair protein YtfE (RIC family)
MTQDDAYELLHDEHVEVAALLARYQESGDDITAREIADALTVHATIEEKVVYPALRRYVDGGDDLANDAEAEHAAVKSLIAQLLGAPPADLRPLMEAISHDVSAHVEREEQVIFPAMREAGIDSEELGQKLRAARAEVPSRGSGDVG